jgi:hypothetical protein
VDEHGFLTVAADPFALVRIDGVEAGTTPIFRRKLPIGQHEIVLVSPDSGAVRLRRSVHITPGDVREVIAR